MPPKVIPKLIPITYNTQQYQTTNLPPNNVVVHSAKNNRMNPITLPSINQELESPILIPQAQTNYDIRLHPNYSEKSFAVIGKDIDLFKTTFLKNSGLKNENLKNIAPGTRGFIFANFHRTKIDGLLENIKNGTIQPEEDPTSESSSKLRDATSPKRLGAKKMQKFEFFLPLPVDGEKVVMVTYDEESNIIKIPFVIQNPRTSDGKTIDIFNIYSLELEQTFLVKQVNGRFTAVEAAQDNVIEFLE